MAKSTQVITDATTVAGGTFSALSLAKAISPTGPIESLESNAALVLLKTQELKNACTQLKAGIDAGDPLLTTLQQIIDVLV